MLCDEIISHHRNVYIGHTRVPDHPTMNRLKPLAMATPSGWERVPDASFPRHGLVFSADHFVVGRPPGYIVLFTVEKNTRAPTGREYDEYITTEICEPFQVVSGFEELSPDSQRALVTLKGLDRDLQMNTRIVLPIGGGRAVFPEFKYNSNTRLWAVSMQEDLAALPIYEFNAQNNKKNYYCYEGKHYLLPGLQPRKKISHINWDSDTAFLEELLKHLRRTTDVAPGGALHDVSKRTLERLQSAYRDAEIINSEHGKNEAIRFRLATFLPNLKSSLHAIDEIATKLLETPAVKAKMVELSEQEKSERLAQVEERFRNEIRTKIEAETQEVIARNTELAARNNDLELAILEKTNELDRLEELKTHRLDGARAVVESVVGSFREGGAKINDLLEAAETLGIQFERGEKHAAAAKNSAPPWAATKEHIANVVDEKGLVSALTDAARKCGVDLDLFARVDIATRAGDVAIVDGDAAELLIDAYAACVTAGAMHRMSVDPTILCMDDLWIHPVRKQETSFAEAWRSALNDDGRYWLVKLDTTDADRLTTWFDRFTDVFRTTRPPNLLLIATRPRPVDRKPSDQAKHEIAITSTASTKTLNAILAQKGEPRLVYSRLAIQTRTRLEEDTGAGLFSALANASGVNTETVKRLIRLTETARAWKGVLQASDRLAFEMLNFKSTNSLREKTNA